MNVALSELPDFTAMPGTQAQPHHSSGILIGPSLQYFEQAVFRCEIEGVQRRLGAQAHRRGRDSSTLDDTLAPQASTWPACSASR